MPREPAVPPKAVFTPRRIKQSRLELIKPGLDKDWVHELDAVEKRIKNFVALDIGRLRRISDNEDQLEKLCIALGMKPPIGEVADEELEYSLQNFPVDTTYPTKKGKHKGDVDEGDSSSNISSDLGNEEYRRTLFDSVMARITTGRGKNRVYKCDLSAVPSTVGGMAEGSGTSYSLDPTPEKSLETFPDLSDDLVVNPAPSQNLEPVEPLADDLSPFQKFFLRSKKEIREHVGRMRKKKYHTITEKCCAEFIQFLDDEDIRADSVNMKTLANLFSIAIEKPGEKSFRIQPEELPAVPKQLADLFNDPHVSMRAALHQQIVWDIMYENKKPKETFTTFGTRYSKPWKKNTKERWFFPTDMSWSLVTGQDFWKDLLDSEILESFGKWLLENPEYQKPTYLVSIGFFDRLKEKMEKETDPVTMPMKSMDDLKDFLKKLNDKPMSLDLFEKKKLKKLPRYKELKDAALDRVVTYEGVEQFNPKLDLGDIKFSD